MRSRLRLWIAGLLGRRRFERDLADEVSFHLRKRAEHWQQQGLDPVEARRRARLEFGNVERFKQEVRDTRFGAVLEQARQDLRYSVRSLAHNPGFAGVIIVSLALGIGVNTTLFAVVDAMMLRPLPYEEPHRLVWVERVSPSDPGWSVSPTNREHLAWRERTDLFDGMAAIGGWPTSTVASERHPTERLEGGMVGTGLFALLGVEPLLGRHFLPEEGRPDGDAVVILSHDTWQSHFEGGRDALGATLLIDGVDTTVVGVMPPGFAFSRHGASRFWRPDRRDSETVRVGTVARLAPGVTRVQAQAALEAHAVRDALVRDEEWAVGVEPLLMSRYFLRAARTTLMVLWAAAGVVMLVACANAAGLLLVRCLSRRNDFALQMALGASRWRLVRLFAAEGAVLVTAAGVLGAILSVWGVRALQLLNPDLALRGTPPTFPRLAEASVDVRVLGYTLLLSGLTALLFLLVSTLATTRLGLEDVLRGSSGSATPGGAPRRRAGRLLVVAQVACAFVLLAGGGLLVHSMLNVWRVDLGFEPARVLEVRVELEPSRYWEPPARAGDSPTAVTSQIDAFYEQALRRLSAIPGVIAAGGTSTLPLSHFRAARRIRVEARALPTDPAPWRSPRALGAYEPAPSHGGAEYKAVVGDYFDVMGIAVLRGRDLSATDTASAPWVAVVNESAAARYWPGEDPIGQRITIVGHITREPTPGERPREIVAVVADARQWSPQSEPHEVIYVPAQQQPREVLTVGRRAGQPQRLMRMSFVLKTAGEPMEWTSQAQTTIVEVDPEQTLPRVEPMSDMVGRWTASLLFYSVVGGTFATVTLLFAVVGVYAVLAYSVADRTHEIGVRMALGAGRAGVVRLVLREGLVLALAGLALGLPAALWAARLVPSLTLDQWGGEEVLYGISATEPLTFVLVTILVLGVASLACYRPARRASGVDPMIALRHE
jgi:putative ABC transport system permease protein